MDTIINKIDAINKLKCRIIELEQFLLLLKIGDKETEYKNSKGEAQVNYFSNMSVSSRRWTGTDNPEVTKHINNRDDISLVAEMIYECLSIQIQKLKQELESKLK